MRLAFNGGFKRTHGWWGMKVDGVTLLPPREGGCTVLGTADGRSVRIMPFVGTEEGEGLLEKATWFRQTPPCMYDDGERHGGLAHKGTRGWGAALGGETVIRRSAIGLNETHDTLFVGIGNHVAARVIADGMHHVGAHDVAQLDVNWSYPKIVVFDRVEGKLVGEPLFEGFKTTAGEYLSTPSPRDFFYVTRKTDTAQPAGDPRNAP